MLRTSQYHKAPEVQEWLSYYGHRFHLCPLPPYSPEFNAIGPVWHYVRMHATHNRYHVNEQEFVGVLDETLSGIVENPGQVQGYLNPFL